MDIGAVLKSGHTKSNTMRIVRYVGSDERKFAVLMDIFFNGEYRMTQRSAWAVNYCVQYHPELIKPYLNKCIDLLPKREAHVAVRRNVVRLLQYVEIPEKLKGKVYSHCLDLIDDLKEALAVKVFAVTVATRIARKEPSLVNELQLVVKKHLPHTTVAFHKRALDILSR
jgi:hypothetical protein